MNASLPTKSREKLFPELDTVKHRHPQAFRPNVKRRATTIGVSVFLVSLYIFGLSTLGFEPERLADGFKNFVWIVGLMLPPNPGTPDVNK